jgi:hypothetical protein
MPDRADAAFSEAGMAGWRRNATRPEPEAVGIAGELIDRLDERIGRAGKAGRPDDRFPVLTVQSGEVARIGTSRRPDQAKLPHAAVVTPRPDPGGRRRPATSGI